ncbi:MAG: ASCH domain-containing protein [Clostridia bacterium]|jgi:hypothetical protein
MKILHLTLQKKWFDSIATGIKKEEYRKLKSYWKSRFFNKDGSIKQFDEIHFKNGYNKNCPFMRIEWKGLKITKSPVVFCILLGKVLEIKNWPK